jgi:putative oxidoreductase
METGLLILRLGIGLILAAHGAQKLFGWFGGYGIAGTGGWLESMGFRPGKAHAVLNGVAEFGGGVLLALGFLTPLAAAAIAGVMLVAIKTVHWEKGFFNGNGGYEFNLAIIAGAIALAFTGPGEFSLDHAFGWSLDGVTWGLAAAATALVTAVGTLAVRSTDPAPAETQAA